MPRDAVHRVTSVEPEEYPTGQISRLHVELVADGLASDVLLPVLVARGRRPGPVFGLTAAVHGNELNGIRVIHDLFDRIDVGALRGTVVAVVCVNVPGLHANEREMYGQFDLNHIFPGSLTGNVAQVYAARVLERVVSRFHFLVDLHTASFGRVNSLYVRADLSDQVTQEMAMRLRPQIVVHNPPSDHTLRGAAMEMGIPAITVEIGDPQRFQPSFVKSTRAGLRNVLAGAGMLPKRAVAEGPPPVLCESSGWIYTDRGGLLQVLPDTGSLLEEGQLIARVRNAFGDVIREHRAPRPGIVIGKSINPVAPTGSRILHLGQCMSDRHELRPSEIPL